MASTIDWPISLPKLSDVVIDPPAETRLFSQTDVGPAKVRRRYTFAPRTFRGKFYLTAQQATELEHFFTTTLKGGSLTFNYEHPRTDEPVEVLLRGLGSMSLFNGGNVGRRKWGCDAVFEIRSAT